MSWEDRVSQLHHQLSGSATQDDSAPYNFHIVHKGIDHPGLSFGYTGGNGFYLSIFVLLDFTISIAGVQYSEYLLMFMCENLNATHFAEDVFIFSRGHFLPASAAIAINVFSNMTRLNEVQQDPLM